MERLLTLAEVKEFLEDAAKKRELTPEQRHALEHAKTFAKISAKKSRELVEELKKLPFITELNAYKIADILPRHPDDLRAIFYKERYTLREEDIQQVLEIIEKYI
jgi:DNA-directed RNA polymerase subunit F